MSPRDLIRTILWAVWARPIHFVAQLATLAGGVAAVTLTLAILAGFQAQIDRFAFGPYATTLVVRENTFVTDRHGPPRLADMEALRRVFPGARQAAWTAGRVQIYRDGQAREFAVFGAIGDFQVEVDTPLARGRWFTREEQARGERVCVLGASAAALLGDLGDVVRLSGVGCEVVGILAEAPSRPAERYTDAVLAPFLAVKRRLVRREDTLPDEVDWLTLILEQGTDMAEAEMQADIALRRSRGAPQSRASPFEYGDASASVRQQLQQRNLVGRMLGVISAIAAILSLLALTSLTASALEARRREIALRMTLGADGRDVALQLVGEAVLVGLLGGMLGVGTGYGLAALAAMAWDWPLSWSPGLAAVTLSAGALAAASIGAVFAWRYSRLEPALAARG